MIQIKIFDNGGDQELEINKWLREEKVTKVLNIMSMPMHDNYSNGDICNQWIRTIVVYVKEVSE